MQLSSQRSADSGLACGATSGRPHCDQMEAPALLPSGGLRFRSLQSGAWDTTSSKRMLAHIVTIIDISILSTSQHGRHSLVTLAKVMEVVLWPGAGAPLPCPGVQATRLVRSAHASLVRSTL